MKQVITVEEFCRFMSFSPQETRELIRFGALDAVRFGTERLIFMDSVAALIERIEAYADEEEEDEADFISRQSWVRNTL